MAHSLNTIWIRTRRVAIALVVATLMAGVAWPAATVIDAERGRVVQNRQDIQREIRGTFASRDYERVLTLCDELEEVDPQSGFAQYYRMMATERIARGEMETPTETQRVPLPSQQLPAQPVPSVEPATVSSPTVAAPTILTPPPQPTQTQTPTPTPTPPPPSVARPAETATSSGGTGLPFIGNLSGLELGALIILIVVTVFLIGHIIRFLGRAKTISPTPIAAAEDEEFEPDMGSTPSIEEGGEAWAQPDTSAFDEAFNPEPIISSLDLTAPFDPNELAGVAALTAPHTDLDTAVAAIREDVQRPLEPEMEEIYPEPREASPISLDAEIGPPGFSLDDIEPMKPDEPQLAFQDQEPPTAESESDQPQIVDPDEMLFGDDTPAPPLVAAPPIEDAPTLDLAAAPSPEPEEEKPEALAPPMSTDDLLEGPVSGGPPSFESVDKETTLPPLSLDDVFTAQPPEPTPPPKPTEPVATLPSAEGPLPPPPEDRNVEFDPELLDEPVTPTPPPTAPSGGGDTTLMLDDGEMKDVLREVPTPEETMSASSSILPDPDPDPQFAPHDTGNDDKFMELYRHGLTASEASDWPRAVERLREALNLRPNSAAVKQALRRAEHQSASGSGSSFANDDLTPGL